MERKEKQKQHFDAHAQEYFRATQHPNCLAFNDAIWKQFLQRHPNILPKGAKVLEPMCGHGIAKGHLEAALHPNFHYSAFDYSPALVEIAQARMPQATIFAQDVTTWEANAEYDLIFLSGGLHHVFDHTGEVLKRLRRALKPDGYMLSGEPTYNNLPYRLLGNLIYNNNAKFEADSEQRYALDDLNKHYREAGFTIVDQFYPGLLAYVIAVSAFCFPKLSVGSPALIRFLMKLESPLYRKWLGRKGSFSTMTLLQNA